MILWAQSQKTWQRAGVRSRAEKQGIYSRSGTQGYNLQCPSLPNYSTYSGNLAFNSGKQSRGLFTKNMNALWRVFKFLVWVLAAWSKYLISFWHLRIPKPSLKWECQSWIIRDKRKSSIRKAKFKEKFRKYKYFNVFFIYTETTEILLHHPSRGKQNETVCYEREQSENKELLAKKILSVNSKSRVCKT